MLALIAAAEGLGRLDTPWVMMMIGVPLGWGGARKRSPRRVAPSTVRKDTRFEDIVNIYRLV